jgi:hypothetical protein
VEPDLDHLDLTEFTFEEQIAYGIACSREHGWDEADFVETMVRLLELPLNEVRDFEAVLRPLGYREVCARLRLRQIKRRRERAALTIFLS